MFFSSIRVTLFNFEDHNAYFKLPLLQFQLFAVLQYNYKVPTIVYVQQLFLRIEIQAQFVRIVFSYEFDNLAHTIVEVS